MKFLKLATDKTEKAALSKKTVSLLDEAERIKKTPDWTPKPLDLLIDFEPLRPIPPTSFKKLAPPSSLRELSTHEQLILLKASKLNGAKFPPWDNPPSSDDFTLATGESLFMCVFPSLIKKHLELSPLICTVTQSTCRFRLSSNRLWKAGSVLEMQSCQPKPL